MVLKWCDMLKVSNYLYSQQCYTVGRIVQKVY
jgi:hypothetical protein